MKVLIIERSVLIIERLTDLLSESRKNITVYPANSYSEALLAMENIILDVVLLEDCFLDNQSLLLLKKIREIDNSVPVIILTDDLRCYSKARYISFGVTDFLDKYHEFEKITNAIDSISNKKTMS